MADSPKQRRLAAILAADVVGYTQAMAADEAATLGHLQALLSEVIGPAVAARDGRIFKEMGDGILAEFPSAVGAAQCAAAIQESITGSDTPLRLRIGLHLGDVIVEGDDLFGDGVNLAARLQAEAEPGGIAASAAFRQQVEGRGGLAFRDLGLRSLKNITEPVQVFALGDGDAVSASIPPKPRWPLLLTAFVGAVAALAIWLGSEMLRPDPPRASGNPTVAVLPFENLSPDPEQAFFAEGLAEDLITDLSKLGGMQVVSRTSSFAIDGRLPAAEIAERLNAGYIVTGSVRRAGERLRITANLIDPEGDTPLWAERFDGSSADVFGFQDQITSQIVTALQVKLTPAEQRAVSSHGTDNAEAYDAYLRGLRLLSARRRLDTEANQGAQAAFEKAILLDPEYAQAYAGLAWAKWEFVESINVFNWESDTREAFELAERSIAIEDNALAHRTLAKRHFALMNTWIGTTRDAGASAAELEAARKLQPNDPDVLADLASVLPFAGRPDEALAMVHRAMELNPNHPGWYFAASGIAYLLTGRAELAVRDLERWRESSPNWPVPYMFLASAHGLVGDADAAKAAFDRHSYLYNDSVMTLYSVKRTWPMAPAEEEFFLRGLKVAGVKDIPG